VPQITMVVTPGARPAWERGGPAVVAWALWVVTMLGLVVIAWLDHLLGQAGRPDLAQLGAAAVAPVLAAVSASTVGAVLASRRPRHPVGWLLLALGLSLNRAEWPRRTRTTGCWPGPAR
jgi:hypothetical protein